MPGATRRQPQIIFLLAWLVPSWLVFEAVPTKLPHYVLPLYPAIALLVAAALDAGALAAGRWTRCVLLLVPALAIASASPASARSGTISRRSRGSWSPFALIGGAAAVLAWRRYGEGRAGRRCSPCRRSSAIALYWGVYFAGMPSLPALWPSPRLAAMARTMDCAEPAFASAGLREPSLVFLVGTGLAMPDGAGAAQFLAAGPCRMAFVEGREEGAFTAQASSLALAPRLVGRVGGININGGRALDIGVYRSP